MNIFTDWRAQRDYDMQWRRNFWYIQNLTSENFSRNRFHHKYVAQNLPFKINGGAKFLGDIDYLDELFDWVSINSTDYWAITYCNIDNNHDWRIPGIMLFFANEADACYCILKWM